jgi:hypothetical protein
MSDFQNDTSLGGEGKVETARPYKMAVAEVWLYI